MIDEKQLLLTIENMAKRIRHLETLTAGAATVAGLLLEDGGWLLLEDGGELLME